MNSDPHLNSVKKEEDEDAFLDDLDLQDGKFPIISVL